MGKCTKASWGPSIHVTGHDLGPNAVVSPLPGLLLHDQQLPPCCHVISRTGSLRVTENPRLKASSSWLGAVCLPRARSECLFPPESCPCIHMNISSWTEHVCAHRACVQVYTHTYTYYTAPAPRLKNHLQSLRSFQEIIWDILVT